MLIPIARLTVVAGSAMLVLGQTPSASACTLDPCSPSVRIPAETRIPGNLVYFEVRSDDPSLALHTSDGVPIAAQVRELGGKRVFAPDAAIPELTDVVLDYATVCIGDFGPDIPNTFAFTTLGPLEVTLQPATLQLRERGIKYLSTGAEDSFVRLLHGTPDATGSAVHLLTRQATVDGHALSFVDVGGLSLLELSTRCSPSASDWVDDTCGTLYSVPPGKHVVEVTTAVLGQSSVPAPVRLEVDVSCPSSVDTDVGDQPTPIDNVGTEPDQHLGDATDTADTTSRDVAPTSSAADATAADSGCAMDGHGRANAYGASALAALALAFAAVARRARRG